MIPLHRGLCRFAAVVAFGSVLAGLAVEGLRADDPPPSKERAVVATVATAPGSVLTREAGKPWHIAKAKEELFSNDMILGMPGAAIESKNGAVRLAFLTELGSNAPFPVKECAVILHPNPDVDLDLTLDRGRADLVNRKEKGPAKVRVRVREHAWDVTLNEPGARIAFELFGRWAKGVSFQKNPKPDHVPVADMAILVIKGEVELKHAGRQFAMHAPPGPAIMHWDSQAGSDSSPERLETLPEWALADYKLPADAVERLDNFRKLLMEKSLDEAVEGMIQSNDEKVRRLAVYAMAALDNLPLLAKYMSTTSHPDVMDNGILAFRNWIGRGPGQDQKLYQMLIEVGKFTPVHAAITMQLLHSFSDEQLAQPEIYELLIDYLDHERPAIRAIAHWHLIRLAPAGKSIAYNPLDDKDKRAPGIAAWRKLIPTGKLPPKEKASDK